MTGFTFYFKGKDYFIETTQQRKTEKFIKDVLNKLDIPAIEENITWMNTHLNKANCEIKGISKKYYEISGDGFAGHGSFLDDGKTIIVKMD